MTKLKIFEIPTTPEIIARIPAGLDFTTAAALPIAGIAAYEGIMKNLKIKPGDKVLIQGDAGGVSSTSRSSSGSARDCAI